MSELVKVYGDVVEDGVFGVGHRYFSDSQVIDGTSSPVVAKLSLRVSTKLTTETWTRLDSRLETLVGVLSVLHPRVYGLR